MIIPTKTERDAIKREYGTLFASISAALFEADPVGINFEINPDEYEPEVGTIIPRLGSAKSAADVQAIVYDEFCTWFGPSAGPREQRAPSPRSGVLPSSLVFRLTPAADVSVSHGANYPR
jgi:hypothetical protein